MRRTFTLIELLVVMSIIVVATSIVSFPVKKTFLSYQKTKTINILKSSLSQAQNIALQYRTTAGIKIERSFLVDENGLMKKNNENEPFLENHQQIKFVIFGHKQNDSVRIGDFGNSTIRIPETQAFRKLMDTETIELSEYFWVAPGNVLSDFEEMNVNYQPKNPFASSYVPLEDFFLLFNEQGELRRKRNSFFYLDEVQQYNENGVLHVPAIEYSENVSISAIVYERNKFEEENDKADFLRQGSLIIGSRSGRIP